MKRTIYQCDRCARQAETGTKPDLWVIAEIRKSEDNKVLADTRLWCDSCWIDVKHPLPQESAR